MLLYVYNSATNASAMPEDKPSKPEPSQQEDAARLRALYETYRTDGGLKQEDFAPKYGLKSQSNMGHYLHGRRPLNLRAAIGFARGLTTAIEAFSPTIAAEIEEAAPLARDRPYQTAEWPLPSVAPADYYAMDPSERAFIDQCAVHSLKRHRTMKLVHQPPATAVESDRMPLEGKTKK